MSTAYYPQGMRSMPSSGYNHQSTYASKQYISWKGSGIESNPVGNTSGHIRPLTNNDAGNSFPTGFGLPRPIKHFRKGRLVLSAEDDKKYNVNRHVVSSKGASLGGGAGGRGLLNQMQDAPGGFVVKQNTAATSVAADDAACGTCKGIGIVSSYFPNSTFLAENPSPIVTNPVLCCNQEYKAKRRVIYASTILKKNYYTTHKQYLQNRCKTYDQKAFNFRRDVISIEDDASNTYIANCFPNAEIYDATEVALVTKLLAILVNMNILTQEQVDVYIASFAQKEFSSLYAFLNALSNQVQKAKALAEMAAFISNPHWGVPFTGPSNPNGCKLTVYKPSNAQFAVQGAVDASTRMLRLNVDTITTNTASIRNRFVNYTKNKAPDCNSPGIFQFQNKKQCHRNSSINM